MKRQICHQYSQKLSCFWQGRKNFICSDRIPPLCERCGSAVLIVTSLDDFFVQDILQKYESFETKNLRETTILRTIINFHCMCHTETFNLSNSSSCQYTVCLNNSNILVMESRGSRIDRLREQSKLFR